MPMSEVSTSLRSAMPARRSSTRARSARAAGRAPALADALGHGAVGELGERGQPERPEHARPARRHRGRSWRLGDAVDGAFGHPGPLDVEARSITLSPSVTGSDLLQSCLTRAVRGLRDSGEVAPSAPRSATFPSGPGLGALALEVAGGAAYRRDERRLGDARPAPRGPRTSISTASPSASVGRQERERDPPLEHGREVAAGDLADDLAVGEDRVPGARDLPAVDASPRRRRATPRSRSATSGVAAPEVALVEAHDPAQPGLQRRDARAELVAVQRQPGLEAQRVARAEAGGRDAGVDAAASHSAAACAAGHVELDAVLAGVAGAGDPAGRTAERRTGATAKRGDRRPGSAAIAVEPRPGLGALHREDRARRR